MLDLYMQSKKSFEDVVRDLEKIFNEKLDISETDEGLRCQLYRHDIEFYFFGDHEMEDDLGIEFTQYDYCLSFLKLNRGGYSEEYNEMYKSIAMYYTKKIADEYNARVMLVEDSQKVVKKIGKN